MTDQNPSMPSKDRMIARYLHLTKTVLPELARSDQTSWPVVHDHCFQRIVLDQISGGVWYDYIARPAYKNMTADQAEQAVALCDQIIAGTADLSALNRQSLAWRGKLRD